MLVESDMSVVRFPDYVEHGQAAEVKHFTNWREN